ncbi:MAG TPA: hypothetical protein VKE94_19200, partial [Gemmataceae bacterium]|nr:hypothetical protein [Gemmataceae bacterium]
LVATILSSNGHVLPPVAQTGDGFLVNGNHATIPAGAPSASVTAARRSASLFADGAAATEHASPDTTPIDAFFVQGLDTFT